MSKKTSGKKSSKKHSARKYPQTHHKTIGAVKPSIRLSQCMIVKNEEKNIEKALSWGKGIVCEQIVVDTGSTDRTVEIAQRMGAKVYHFPWIDDFAAAKNHAIEQATGNWIAFLDADEYFPDEDAEKLIWGLQEVHHDKNVDFVRTRMVHTNEDGSVKAVACQDRVFRNDKVKYKYRIHEQLCHEEKERMGCHDAQEVLTIIHTGYGKEDQRPEKGERNAALILKDLEERPKDALLLMYLGDAYNMAEKTEEARECYRRVLWEPDLETDHHVAYLRSGLQLLRTISNGPADEIKEEVFNITDKLIEMGFGYHPDIDFYRGKWHVEAGDLSTATQYFEKAQEKLVRYNDGEVATMTAYGEYINRVIAADAITKGEMHKTVKYAVEALKIEKYSSEAAKLLLTAFLSEWKPGVSAQPYWQFLCKIYDAGNLKDMLFLRKFAQITGFKALEQCIWEAFPLEVREHLEKQEEKHVN